MEKREIVLISLIVIVLIGAVFYSGILKKNCNEDKECFDKTLEKCKASKLLTIRNNNVYSYEIGYNFYKPFSKNCEMKVKIERVGAGVEIETRNLIEGKSMKCSIPKDKLKDINLGEMDDLLNYCSGKLKEGLYEIIIKKMYSLILGQMSGIINEMERVLKEDV